MPASPDRRFITETLVRLVRTNSVNPAFSDGTTSEAAIADLVSGKFAATVPITYGLGGGIVCGADTGSPVTTAYKPPFHFTGTLYQVTIDVSGELIRDEEAEMRMVMTPQ